VSSGVKRWERFQREPVSVADWAELETVSALEMPGTQWFNIAQDRAAWCNKIEIK
jgi:hypothetical protein